MLFLKFTSIFWLCKELMHICILSILLVNYSEVSRTLVTAFIHSAGCRSICMERAAPFSLHDTGLLLTTFNAHLKTYLFSTAFEAMAHLWHLWFICAAYKCTYLLTYLLTPSPKQALRQHSTLDPGDTIINYCPCKCVLYKNIVVKWYLLTFLHSYMLTLHITCVSHSYLWHFSYANYSNIRH